MFIGDLAASVEATENVTVSLSSSAGDYINSFEGSVSVKLVGVILQTCL